MWILISTIAALTSLAVLYALHRFRPHARLHTIATLIFWQQAAGSQNVTTLSQKRFGQPRTFILLASILLLLAAGMLGTLAAGRVDEARRVVVIDASSNMDWPAADVSAGSDRLLDQAIKAVESDIAQGDSPTVIAADDNAKVIARAGEPTALMLRQLERLRSEIGAARPLASGSALALNLAEDLLDEQSHTEGAFGPEIDWYTDQSVIPDGIAPSVAARVRIHHVMSAGRVGISGVLLEAMDATATGAGRLRVHVARSSLAVSQPIEVALSSPGIAGRVQSVKFAANGWTADVLFTGFATDAHSATLSLRAATGEATVYQTIPISLPNQTRLRIEIGGGISPALRAAAEAIDSGNGGRSSHAIAIVKSGSALPADATASVQIVSEGVMLPAGIHITPEADQPLVADLNFEDAVTAAGPVVPSENLLPILRAGDAVVASLDSVSRTVYLSSALVNEPAELPRRAAFPVLLTRAFRRLAGWTELPLAVPACRLINDPLWQRTAGASEAIGVDEIPPKVIKLAELAETHARGTHRDFSLLPRWCLAFALALLTFEGALLARRKIT
jgi:hypothetical protein